ncbi:MAG: hypothetical protein U5O39_11790 [Gammaproteobacteria bacterium]|nr:hypothetical protein [Gammaproteobacteria bacterium]
MTARSLSQDTNGGMGATTYHLLSASLTQTGGSLDVQANLHMDGATTDLSAGTVNVASGAELLISSSTVTWGDSANVTGGGTVRLDGGTATFNTAFTLDGTTPAFDLTAQTGTLAVMFVTVIGTLTIGSTQSLASDGDVIGVDLCPRWHLRSVTGQVTASRFAPR